MKTANAFTTVRIVFSPIVFLLYFVPYWTQSFFELSVFLLIPIIIFAEFTDFLDGFFARRQNTVSDFGKLYDPFADVFLHLTLFACFAFSGYLPSWIFILILYREFSMLFIRLLAAKQGVAIGARKGGKLKTVLYVIAAFYSLVIESLLRLQLIAPEGELRQKLLVAGYILYGISLIASYVSFSDYLIQCKPILFGKNKK